MQELLAAPVRLLHRSARLTLEQLALVETLGIGFHAVERAALSPGEAVVVVGAGPIGLAASQFALLAGARVAVLDTNQARLRFCRRRESKKPLMPPRMWRTRWRAGLDLTWLIASSMPPAA